MRVLGHRLAVYPQFTSDPPARPAPLVQHFFLLAGPKHIKCQQARLLGWQFPRRADLAMGLIRFAATRKPVFVDYYAVSPACLDELGKFWDIACPDEITDEP